MENKSEARHKERILFSALDFFKRDFEVNDAEIAKILSVKTEDVQGWFTERRVDLNDDENLEIRIALLIGIHWNLIAMFSASENRMAWLRTPHPNMDTNMFKQRSPLEAISRPGGLSAVNSYTAFLVGEGA